MARKLRKIIPYTRNWEKLANDLARSIVMIHPCKDCGRPVNHGYCCSFCKSNDPLWKLESK